MSDAPIEVGLIPSLGYAWARAHWAEQRALAANDAVRATSCEILKDALETQMIGSGIEAVEDMLWLILVAHEDLPHLADILASDGPVADAWDRVMSTLAETRAMAAADAAGEAA